jgi:hypothetical protein
MRYMRYAYTRIRWKCVPMQPRRIVRTCTCISTRNRYMPYVRIYLHTHWMKCLRTCWDTDSRTYVNVDAVRACVSINDDARIHALGLHAYARTRAYTFIYTVIYVRTHSCVNAFILCVRKCDTILSRKSHKSFTCLRCMHALIPTYVDGTYVHTGYGHTDMHVNVDTYMHFIVIVHTYMNTYMRYTHFHYIHTFVHA